MPLDVTKIKNLQTFDNFIVGRSHGFGVEEVGNFPYLTELRITKLKNVPRASKAWRASLKNKKHLLKLELIWDDKTDDAQLEERVLENLEPHVNLKDLVIRFYGGFKFPGWLGDHSFSNIVTLGLYQCYNCHELPSLGQLQSLKHLDVKGLDAVKTVSLEFYGRISPEEKAFRSLEWLAFDDLLIWEEWKPQNGHDSNDFPRLRRLSITSCPNLKGCLPSHLPCLNELVISDCEKLELPVYDFEYPFLQTLSISSSYSLQSLPLHLFPRLISLDLYGCGRLENLWNSSDPLTCLREIVIESCRNLKFMPEPMLVHLPFLTKLTIRDCPDFETTSLDGRLPSKLEKLELEVARSN